jgi:hypothetical protein
MVVSRVMMFVASKVLRCSTTGNIFATSYS